MGRFLFHRCLLHLSHSDTFNVFSERHTVVSSALGTLFGNVIFCMCQQVASAQLVDVEETGSECRGSSSSFAKILFRVDIGLITTSRSIVSRSESGPVQKSKSFFCYV